MQYLYDLIRSIPALDTDARAQAEERQAQLTRPAGSLGRLETIAVQMAAMTGQPLPAVKHRAVVVMAADHGVAAEGVSAYPAAVTAQMVLNFLHGGAAINALARQVGADVVVVDIGVATDIDHPQLLVRKVARGTASMARGPAMTRAQALAAVNVGVETMQILAERGVDLVATGEMGIGNTTAASAVTAALLGVPAALVTGYGTGIDEQRLAHKIALIEQSLVRNQPDAKDPLDVLAKVGGLELAGLVGVILAAAARRVPVILDGFISSAAGLVAFSLAPAVRDYLFAGHVSVERGHRPVLERIGLRPLLDLGMRLGEGTGAVLAMHVIEAALRTHREMATFAEAGVSERSS